VGVTHFSTVLVSLAPVLSWTRTAKQVSWPAVRPSTVVERSVVSSMAVS
jgi:hypothetical protein